MAREFKATVFYADGSITDFGDIDFIRLVSRSGKPISKLNPRLVNTIEIVETTNNG